jgi:hypothetical protein
MGFFESNWTHLFLNFRFVVVYRWQPSKQKQPAKFLSSKANGRNVVEIDFSAKSAIGVEGKFRGRCIL